MSFTNMSPADRMKASGLIGLIVVAVFFIAHTMLGALAPKKTGSAAAKMSAQAGVPGPPAPLGGPTDPAPTSTEVGPAGQGQPFPVAKAASATSSLKDDPSLGLNIQNPFEPIRDPKAKPGAQHRTGPDVAVVTPGFDPHRPVGAISPFEVGGGPSGSLPPLEAGLRTGMGPAGEAPAPAPEPQIRLIGIVHGEPSVATVQVATRILLARPGDALAKGYRLTAVDAEGVRIRHDGERVMLRVGGALNEPKAEK